MRRKLNNELSSFLENIESESESEDDNESDNDENDSSTECVNDTNTDNDENTFNKMIHRDYKTIHNRIDLCFLMSYLMFLGSLYGSIAYLICSYKHIIQIPIPVQYSTQNQSEQFCSKSSL